MHTLHGLNNKGEVIIITLFLIFILIFIQLACVYLNLVNRRGN